MAESAGSLDPQQVERLRSGLRIIALRSLSDRDQAEEVVQETLTRGLQALADRRVEDPSRIGAYFRGICRNVIVDTIRRSGRTVSIEAVREPADPDPGENALSALINAEQKARVRRALDALSPEALECVRLSFYEGLKPAEVAARLGEPGPRVRKRLSRALQQLRTAFIDQGPTASGHESGDNPTLETDGERADE